MSLQDRLEGAGYALTGLGREQVVTTTPGHPLTHSVHCRYEGDAQFVLSCIEAAQRTLALADEMEAEGKTGYARLLRQAVNGT